MQVTPQLWEATRILVSPELSGPVHLERASGSENDIYRQDLEMGRPSREPRLTVAPPHRPQKGADSHVPREPVSTLHVSRQPRHRVNGVGRGGVQAVFNEISTRFHGIQLKSG